MGEGMTLSFADYVAALIFSAVSAGIGAYFGAYLKRKGENLATKEDLDALVHQVKATTQATESIKADLSGRLWLSQERWKLKTDLYISLLTMLDTMGNRCEEIVKRFSRAQRGCH